VDKPIIQLIVEELVSAGIEDIVIVTGSHKRSIEDHFDRPSLELQENLLLGGEKKRPLLEAIEEIADMANFIYVRQKGPYGNGTPLMNVREIIGDNPFIYTFSDDFIVAEPKSRFTQLIDLYNEYGWSVLTAIKADKEEDFKRYGYAAGRTIRDGLIDVESVIEKPGKAKAPSDLASVSSYLFTPEIFNYLEQAKDDMSNPDFQGLLTYNKFDTINCMNQLRYNACKQYHQF
jgi:UTP--glucose-1-phosphate uridylyltransferase